MDYIFVLGKNMELSVAEIDSYFESRGLHVTVKKSFKSVAIVESEKGIDTKRTMSDLGGTIKICEVLKPGEIDLMSWFPGFGEELRFGVSVYSEKGNAAKLWEETAGKIKATAREERLKIIHVTPKDGYELRHLDVLQKLMKRDGYEIVVSGSDESPVFARTVAVHNPHEFMKRDIGRPVQRTIYSIPPRLAKIMINLSHARPGDLLLDPFCGIGTIVQEALLMGIKTIGSDKDPKCIKAANRNLKWIGNEYRLKTSGKLINEDVTQLTKHIDNWSVDAVATEPYLGPALKEMPSKNEAKRILKDIENLYSAAFGEIHRMMKGGKYMCIVSPNFMTKSGETLRIDMRALCNRLGFKICKGPILDAEKRHLTRREIYVLQKRV